MAKKVFLRDENKVELLPITRGELILDSSGKMALRSDKFLASTEQHGLMSAEDKEKIDNVKTDDSLSTTSVNPVQNKVVTAVINKTQADASEAKTTANANKEELTKTQQILNAIKTSYLKSASVSGNTLTIKDQNDSEVKFYNTTYGIVSSSSSGLAPAIGTSVSSIISNQVDEWVLTSTKGGAPTWRKLPMNAFLDNNDNTTYTLSGALSGNAYDVTLTPSSGSATGAKVPAMGAANASTAGKAGLVPAPPAGAQGKVLSGAGTWISIPTLSITDTGNGNAVTDVTVSGHSITLKKESAFSLQGHTHSTSDVTSLTRYSKASSIEALATSDTLNAALGKLEYKADCAWNWISSVTAEDTDEYINKWGEIVEFVDFVNEGANILDEFVTRKTAQTITGAKTFNEGISLYGITNYTGLPDSSHKFGKSKGLLHLKESNASDYYGNAITWAYGNSEEAQAGIYVTTGGGYGSEMWFATTNLFSDGPKAALKIDNYGNIHGIRGNFLGKFVTTGGSSSHFVKGDGSLDSNTYITPNTLANHLPTHQSISFKNASNTTVSYNGSSALNLTGGIYYALNSRYVQCPDTRSISIIPSSVGTGVSFDFKAKSVTSLSGAYAGIMTFRPYGSNTDWSGGPVHNLAFDNDGLHHRMASSDTWGVWSHILTSANFTNYVNTDNFPGLNKTGTITEIIAGSGLSGGGTSGSVTLTNTGVRSVTVEGNYLCVNTNGTYDNLTVPFATSAGSTTVWANSTVSTDLNTVENKHGWANSSGTATNLPTSVSAGTVVSFSNSNSKLQFFGGYKTTHGLHYRKWYNSSWESWRTILDSTNFTSYVNESNFPGLNKVGTVTKVSTGTGLTGGDIIEEGTIELSPSGVIANSYGPTTAVTGSNNTEISIPHITVDIYGRITGASNKTYIAQNYYPRDFDWEDGTTEGPVGKLSGVGIGTIEFPAIPSASKNNSGVITTDAQTIAGAKTFTGTAVLTGGGSGSDSITYDKAALTIGTMSRIGNIDEYYPGIAFNHMYGYAGGSSFRNHAHAWIGLRLESTPGSELSSLIFATQSSTTNGTSLKERMCITPEGTVGIGTTSPTTTYKLYVNGSIYSSSINSTYIQNIHTGYLPFLVGRVYKGNGSSNAYTDNGMSGLPISISESQVGRYIMTITNNTGRTVRIHTPIVTPIFRWLDVGACKESPFAFLEDTYNYSYPRTVLDGNTIYFAIVCGRIVTSTDWNINHFTQRDDTAGFSCCVYGSWYS